MNPDFADFIEHCQQRINGRMIALLGGINSEFVDTTHPAMQRLLDAMRYSVLNGGKRVRPVLVYATAESIGDSDAALLDQVAAAVECIHCYSLIHDDLPAMDNDQLRRGQPTCHIAFDEATAILAGDALQARAFELLADLPRTDPSLKVELIRQLAAASGQRGMAAGQAIDLQSANHTLSQANLQLMHQLKTGALIRAAVRMGALCAGADVSQLQQLDQYGNAIGLSFQVQDDILDIESSTEVLGKTQGADQALNKPTYPALLGLDGARAYARELHETALQSLAGFGARADRLRQLSAYIIGRSS